MSSLITGFEYDIFISYRHNDNRSGWVTEFVKALQEELAATIKEPLSVYYDTNPHDGLLETHNVDKSLEGKLKCLIFIPIISQTYCDPKSFAWQHEFMAFNKLAQEDQLGRDIKLSNGNVASRILPVKIHELDTEDRSTIENEIGGVLRAIEFIYTEAGVNRPLKSTDDRALNLEKTDYQNQINKVANAIKDLIATLNSPTKSFADRIEDKIVNPVKKTRKLGAIIALIVFLVALIGYFLYPKMINVSQPEELIKSIAVLPFDDLSPNKDQEYFSDGLAEEIINVLMQIPDAKVVGRTSSFSFKGSNTDIQTIGETLKASHLIHGSVRKAGNMVKIQVNLIDAVTGLNIKSYSFPETQLENIFQIQGSIAQSVTNDLKLSLFSTQGDQIATSQTKNPEALEEFFRGRKLWYERRNLWQAVAHFEKAIAIDSNYSRAYSALAETYGVLPSYTNKYNLDSIAGKAIEAIENSLRLNQNNAEAYTAKGRIEWKFKLNRRGAEVAYQKALAINQNYGPALAWFGHFYQESKQFKKAEEYYLRTIALEPRWAVPYIQLSTLYLSLDDPQRAAKMNQLSNEIQPDLITILRNIYFLAIYNKDFDRGIKVWVNYYNKRCADSDCNENDLVITTGLLKMLASNEFDPNLVKKIAYLKFGMDRIYFAAIVGERSLLLDELMKLKKENSYEFIAVVNQHFLNKYNDDAEFKTLYKSVGID